MGKNIESESIPIQRAAGDIYAFLADFTNFSHLVPGQVENWQATADYCSFEVRGLAALAMRIIERQPVHKVVMKGEGKIPFNFSLICTIRSLSPSLSEVKLVMETDMSTFIAMMAEKPLSDFVNVLISKLKEYMENGNT